MTDPGAGHDLAANVERFSGLVAEHGHSAQALGWGSTTTQHLRFDVLTAIADLDGCRVLDVGAGLGDLYGYLAERQVVVDYTGVDVTPAMVEASHARWPGARFEVRDILDLAPGAEDGDERFDYVLASGIFTFHTTRPMEFLERMVRQMYALCRRGVAFNLLSAWAPDPEPDEFVAEPDQVLRMCRTITPSIVLRHDYLEHDFSVYLHRTAP